MSSSEPVPWPRSWRNLALMLVLLGVAWRVLRYLSQFPIWGDEAYICLNLMDRDFLGLARPLRFVQVAPILFLWSEAAAYRLLGGGEWALRLLPVLAGLGSLALFWRLARLTLTPLAGTLAVGILAVAYYPVRHSCEVKPYAFDLFFALALIVAAVSWLERPERRRWLIVLALLVPFALGLSYPAVFVAGAVSVALLPAVWRQRDGKTWALFTAYNTLMLASFAGVYLLAGTSQYDSTGGTQNFYWTDWFPPSKPLPLAKWLALAHTGNMMAYPVGSRDGASALTFLLLLAGVWHFVRQRRGGLLLLLLMPFALTFTAAVLHRYPYGGSARVAQHLAPAICFLAGTGAALYIAGLARWFANERRLALVACGLLAAVGVIGMARDWRKPYKTDGDRMVRQLIADVAMRAGPDDQIIVLNENAYIGATFEWYLRRQGDRVAYNGAVDWERLRQRGDVWAFSFTHDGRAAFEAHIPRGERPMLLVEHQTYDLQLGQTDDTRAHCEVFCWRRMYGE